MDTDMSMQRQRRLSDEVYAASYFDLDEDTLATSDDKRATKPDRGHNDSLGNCLKRRKSDTLSIVYCEDFRTSIQHALHISPNKTLANLRERICNAHKWPPNETTLWYQSENHWKSFVEQYMSITLDELSIDNMSLLSITRTISNNTLVGRISEPPNSGSTSPTIEESVYRRVSITYPANKQTLEVKFKFNNSLDEFKQIVKEQFDINTKIDDLHLYSDDTEIHDKAILKNLTTALLVVRKKSRSPSLQNRNRPVGLLNLGNTCFMNSALQCLIHIPALTNYFHRTSVEGPVATAYQKVIQHVWNGHETAVDPREIRHAVSQYASRFSDFNQQDAREFLSILLNRLDEDLKRKQQNTIITELFHGQIDTVFSCSNCDKVLRTPNDIHFIPLPLRPKERAFTILFIPLNPGNIQESIYISVIKSRSIAHVVRNFVAQYPHASFRQLRVRSSQTHEEMPYETALTDVSDQQLTIIEEDGEAFLQHDILENKSRTLLDCLRDYFAPEPLHDPWYCNGKCQRETDVEKRLEFTVSPSVLVLQLERFTNVNGVRRKLEMFVEYPIGGLNINGLLKNGSEKPIYDLVAVADHSGSIRGGHYVTFARDVNADNWYRFSDSSVSRAQPNDVISSNAYLLFYIQQNVKETAF